MNMKRRVRILSAAVASALAAASTVHAVVQDYNRALGADGYTSLNAAGDLSGTFDGQEFQPAAGQPGLQGEFFFVGSGLGQPFDLDAHAPLGQGVTGTANDHGGYLFVDYKGASGGPFYWYGGMGNEAGPFPGIVLVGGDVQPLVPALSQVLAYADVLAPAGKPFRFYINSPYDGQDHQLSFSGVGTGAWQTVGGPLSSATPINGGVVYSNLPYETPNNMAMTVQFASEIAGWDSGPGGPAVLRMDNLTFTPASVSWAGTSGGNWSDNSRWTPLLAGGIPIAPSGRNAVAIFGPSAAPQTIALDAPVVLPWGTGPGGSGGDISPRNSFYAGTVRFDSAQSYTLTGPEPLQIATTAANGVDLSGPSGLIQVLAGSHTIAAPVILRRSTDIDVAAGSTLTVTGAITVFSDNGEPVTLAKAGSGTAVLNNARVTGSLAVNGGTLKIAPSGGAAGTSFVPGVLSVTAGARLDLSDNTLITATPVGTWSGTSYTGVAGMVDSARGNAGSPTWSGSGLTTSDARAQGSNLVTVGVAKAGDIKGIADTATATFAGQTVLGSDTIAMVTYGGDATLDGKINIDDYGRIDANVAQSGTVFGWYNGDFNYDGAINIDDYGIIDGNISSQGAPFSTAGDVPASVAAVPEPASAVVLAAAVMAAMRRKRPSR